jgi:poly(A) polymerase
MNVFEVGGHVRDSFLAKPSNDIDYVIEAGSFDEMKSYVLENSKNIFLEKPEFGTIRYMSLTGSPEDISLSVKTRKSDGSIKELGPIEEDLKNRDFTINAMARLKLNSKIIDPFNGQADIKNKIIKCTSDPHKVFNADPVRIIRAIRFKIELGFIFDSKINDFFSEQKNFSCLLKLNRERLRQELDKCFKVSTYATVIEMSKLGEGFLKSIYDQHKIGLKVR